MASNEAGPLRMMLTLGIAGLASGLVLVSVYLLTAPRIERNRAEALEAAIYQVVPGAIDKSVLVIRGDKLEPFESPDGSLPKEPAIYIALDDSGNELGYAIPAEGGGFQDTIGLIYGYDPATRTMMGMRVLQSLETPGLGDKIIKDQKFVGAFEGLAVDPKIVAVKDGADAPNEVDSISGATISSKAVVRIINQSNQTLLDRLPELQAKAEVR